MGTVKKVKKLIFISNFSFYFKFLAINGTEKTRLCPQLVIEFLGGCPELVTETLRILDSLAVSVTSSGLMLGTAKIFHHVNL